MEKNIIRYEVKNKDDFVLFLSALRTDLQVNPDGWKNVDLMSFLGSMLSWTKDVGDFYMDESDNQKDISWQVFADILSIARVYE